MEKKTVMAEILRLEQNGIHGTNGEMIRKGVTALPPERRNHVPTSNSGIASFMKRMRHLVSSGHLQAAEKAPQATFEPPEHKEPEQHEVREPEIVYVDRVIIQKEEADFGRIPTTTLVRILCERLQALEEVQANLLMVTDSFRRKREQEREYDRRLDTRPTQEHVKDEPVRITIIGPLPAQQHEIEEKTTGITKPFKLHFLDTTHGATRSIPSLSQHVIVWKFASHAWWEKAKAEHPASNVHFVDGGLTSIVQKVYDIISRQPAAAMNGKH